MRMLAPKRKRKGELLALLQSENSGPTPAGSYLLSITFCFRSPHSNLFVQLQEVMGVIMGVTFQSWEIKLSQPRTTSGKKTDRSSKSPRFHFEFAKWIEKRLPKFKHLLSSSDFL